MKKFIYGLAFTHLTLVALSIFHVMDKIFPVSPVSEKCLTMLCSINYSVWRFGFFSPDVGKSNELEIITYNLDGTKKKYSTLEGFNYFLANKDLGQRFYGYKVHNAGDTLLQDLCARSVATRMMNLFPGTYKVSYTLRSIRYPTIQGYRRKEPIQTVKLYSTDFIAPYYFMEEKK